MAGYNPLKITGNTTGLIQEREDFLLPDDAYPVLQNAYVLRERILRKKGLEILSRLQRNIGITDAFGGAIINITPTPIQSGISYFVIGTDHFQDQGGASPVTMLTNSSGSATLNRATGVLTIIGSIPLTDVQYFPGLPVMGIRSREIQNISIDQTIFFDQNYAYIYNNISGAFEEWITGTTWNASSQTFISVNFFYSTNYWVSGTPSSPFGTSNKKLFWVTNGSGSHGINADPPRISDGATWINFFPSTWSQLDSTNYLTNWLAMTPFRGRLVTFNTWEGPTANGSLNYPNRIRWSTIGNPFIPYAAGPPTTGSWRDDVRGQGGFLDIPTNEDIIAIGSVRDNLVIYCERSTWQIRYTGRSISPFQIEKINSELGSESTFSAIQFDTSILGIGDKGVVECDSYKSERIDIKIPDFVFHFNGTENSTQRVHGVRDFINRLAFWTVPLATSYDPNVASSSRIFPNNRLVYNYENDSWALFTDTLTTLGIYQPQSNRTWLNTHIPWILCKFPWIQNVQSTPSVVGGNQQGWVFYLDKLTVNESSLFISNIIASSPNPTIVVSPNHNLTTGSVIQIRNIDASDPFFGLNDSIFGISILDANRFEIFTYDSSTGQFSEAQVDTPSTDYTGGALITLRENFNVTSKKFNFIDEGQSIQIGYIDLLMQATDRDQPGAITMNMYLDYNDSSASNTIPYNDINDNSTLSNPDTFFNSTIPTAPSTLNNIGGSKFWHRVFCSTRADFLTIQYTFSNAQLAAEEQTKDIQIDAQIIWMRKAGRLNPS